MVYNKDMDTKIGPEHLESIYGEKDAVVGPPPGLKMTLRQALQLEAEFCPASDDVRLDPVRRASYIAGILSAAGSLMPEHQHLVSEGTET